MARKPFRSPLLGYLLIFLGCSAVLSILVVDWAKDQHSVVIALLFLGPALGMLGSQLIRKDATLVLANSKSRPIVYLRPFSDEDLLSPGGQPWRALWQRYKMDPAKFILLVLFAYFGLGIVGGLLGFLGGVFAWLPIVAAIFHAAALVVTLLILTPAYAYRRMRGRVNITLEQELHRQLRRNGPFVAIGEPGEWFAPEGAARVYLDDDSWKDTGVEMISKAQIVIVHVVPSGWTWWEFVQTMKLVESSRVLGVLGGDWLNKDSYNKLKKRAKDELAISLPDEVGEFSFLGFKPDGSTCVLPIRRIPWIFKPFTSFHLSGKTFSKFVLSHNRD